MKRDHDGGHPDAPGRMPRERARLTGLAGSHGSHARLATLVTSIGARPRPVRVVQKSAHWHQRAAARALWALTFGGQRTYLSHYVTTLGHTIYVPDDFAGWHPDHAWQVLRHELVHVRQFERYGWLGMILVYGLMWPFPRAVQGWIDVALDEIARDFAEPR